MKFKLIEEELDEAKMRNEHHINKHYDEHVLKDGEQFNINDPKFPPMTKQEYLDSAEWLTLQPAKEIHSEEELRTARGIIGWDAVRPGWPKPRHIKINLNSPKKPGFIEIVGYVDDGTAEEQVPTYMLAKRGRKYREFMSKVDELPENKAKEIEKSLVTVG